MSDTSPVHAPPSRIPEPAPIALSDLRAVLLLGWRDFTRAPLFGVLFSAVYVVGGLILYAIFAAAAAEWWFIPIAVGFPILAPFAAVGLYEVSRQLERGHAPALGAVLGCVFAQKDRQVPSMSMVILLVFMFWVFIAHTIFALFFGLQPIAGSTWSMLATPNGLMMLGVGSLIGGVMAAIFYALTVVSLPLLLDREVDFITAMIASFGSVTANPGPMIAWAGVIAAGLFLAMLPGFLGLFVALPVFGHASWHLYRRVLPA
ncbi:MAG: putative integral membrane protein [Rhodobacteraceae bacterium HLUCCA12]|nr:MAG: putative integral membrane protein [Rhodobacteraceae bacterium HLUCCA12]